MMYLSHMQAWNTAIVVCAWGLCNLHVAVAWAGHKTANPVFLEQTDKQQTKTMKSCSHSQVSCFLHFLGILQRQSGCSGCGQG